MQQVGIIGCGWLGSRLAKFLQQRGFGITTTNTTLDKQRHFTLAGYQAFQLNFLDTQSIDQMKTNKKFVEAIKALTVIIISVPASRKNTLSVLTHIFDNVIKIIDLNPSAQIFFFSSTGIYPQISQIISEDSIADDLLNPLLLSVEKQLRFQNPNINILRLAGLMGDERLLSRFYQHKAMINPDQVVNQIHYREICHIVERMIHQRLKGVCLNVVAPLHPTKRAIFTYETTGEILPLMPPQSAQRIINGEALEKLLSYAFLYANPQFFSKISDQVNE